MPKLMPEISWCHPKKNHAMCITSRSIFNANQFHFQLLKMCITHSLHTTQSTKSNNHEKKNWRRITRSFRGWLAGVFFFWYRYKCNVCRFGCMVTTMSNSIHSILRHFQLHCTESFMCSVPWNRNHRRRKNSFYSRITETCNKKQKPITRTQLTNTI